MFLFKHVYVQTGLYIIVMSFLHNGLEVGISIHILHILGQYLITEHVVILRIGRETVLNTSIIFYGGELTVSGMSPGLRMRADLMAWKTSTTPSVFRRSN